MLYCDYRFAIPEVSKVNTTIVISNCPITTIHTDPVITLCFQIISMCQCVCVCVCVCVFLGKGRRGTPHMHGHKESNTDLNLKILTSEWDSNPRPHEY